MCFQSIACRLVVSGVVHVHERPVLDTPIEVLYEDKDVLVVNKPASMVIYPSNGYRY